MAPCAWMTRVQGAVSASGTKAWFRCAAFWVGGGPGPPIPFHRVGGWGNRVSPSPYLRARPSRGRGHGGTWFPRFHVRRSCAWRTTPRCPCPGSAGVPPASRLRGHGDRPCPDPPPPGAGTRRLPPAGGGWEGGCMRRAMVTAAVHAAPPHTDGMQKGSSWEGVALPNPPRGRGLGARASGTRPRGRGETRFPHATRRGRMFMYGL